MAADGKSKNKNQDLFLKMGKIGKMKSEVNQVMGDVID